MRDTAPLSTELDLTEREAEAIVRMALASGPKTRAQLDRIATAMRRDKVAGAIFKTLTDSPADFALGWHDDEGLTIMDAPTAATMTE